MPEQVHDPLKEPLHFDRDRPLAQPHRIDEGALQPAHVYAPSLGHFVPCAFLSSCSSSPGFASEKPAGSVAFSRSTANWFGESSARQPSSDVGIAPLALDSSFPVLGSTWDLTTSNIDPVSPLAITFLGDAGPAVPFLAIGLNAPGCGIHLSTTLGSLTGLATGAMGSTGEARR